MINDYLLSGGMAFSMFHTSSGEGRWHLNDLRQSLLRHWHLQNLHHLLLTIHRKTLGHRWHMSQIITIANQKNTLILLTCSPLLGFSLYKYTIETHIKQLKLESNIMHKWQIKIHISQTVSSYLWLWFSSSFFYERNDYTHFIFLPHLQQKQKIWIANYS